MRFEKRFYILLLILCCNLSFSFASVKDLPLAKEGILDLRNRSFENKVALDGEWEFYWKQLLNPGDKALAGREIVRFPFRWDGQVINGEKLPSFGYATYKLRIFLPSKSESLLLALPDVYSASSLFINGKLVATNGRVATNEKDFVPHWEYKMVALPEGKDTLDVILQISNFTHSKGGIKKSVEIGSQKMMELSRKRDEAIDLILTGCLFMGGFFFLGLYLLGNRDNAILYFALFSMIYSYRVAGIDNYVLHSIMPDIPWSITVHMEYISLFMGICFFARYSLSLYPQVVSKRIIDIISIVCITFAVVTLLLPPIFFTRLVNPFLFVAIFCLVYTPYVYILAYRRKSPGSFYSLLSSFALIAVFAVSLFYYWGILAPYRISTFIAYVGFFFLQSLVLSHRVSFVLNRAREEAEQGLIAKSDFLSTMSHEIRTPLNSVIGMSHLLLKNNPRPDQIEKLEVMLFSANNLLSIVNDVLDYNKIEAGKITFEKIEMDLASITRNIVKALQISAEDKGIDLKLQVDTALKNKVLGDPTRVSQVITNLVHNAIKFTQAGYVQVGIEVTGQTDQHITARIEVKDTGIGISADKQKIIFERFTQADSSTSRGFGGTGLGLAISKKILELQNSALCLDSEEGTGSTFYFIQTFEKSIKTIEQKEHEDSLPKEENKPLTGISVLLVEDNAMNVMVAQSFLQRWGATIDVAVNGQEALDKIDTSRHRLVLMDLHMPVMDGYEATRQMRANNVTIPIVALTADLPREIEAEVRETGIDDIVVKPFLPDELYRKVLHHVNSK
ncbi:response regulator [Flavihumibacter sp. R14]|nr:response regulator [Flavihumibacter soli]